MMLGFLVFFPEEFFTFNQSKLKFLREFMNTFSPPGFEEEVGGGRI